MANTWQICRICLTGNVRMFTLKNTNMGNLYELLTQVHLGMEDGKPAATVCFLCYARLQQCNRLQQQANKSNELLELLLKGGFMHTTVNAVLSSLSSTSSSQDLQVTSIYHLDLEPVACEDAFLVPTVEAENQISVKKELETINEGNMVADLDPVNFRDGLQPTVEANMISDKKGKEAIDEKYDVTDLTEDGNDSSNFDPEVINIDSDDSQPLKAQSFTKYNGIRTYRNKRRKKQEKERLYIEQQTAKKEVKSNPTQLSTTQMRQKENFLKTVKEQTEFASSRKQNCIRL